MTAFKLPAVSETGPTWRDDEAGVLDMLLEITSNAVVTTDGLRRVVRFNRVAEQLTGWPREEAAGCLVSDVLTPLDHESRLPVPLPSWEDLEKQSADGPNQLRVLLSRDGSERLVYVRYRLLRDSAGTPCGLLALFRDFTAALATERAIIDSETRLQRVIEGSRLGYWDWNLETNNVVFSGRWATMLGYLPDELESDYHTWERLVHPEDKPRVMEALHALLEGRTTTYEVEHRLMAKNGGWRWILTRGNIVAREAGGKPLQIAGTHTDIHAKKEAEAAEHRRAEETIRFQKALLALRDYEGQDIGDFLRMAMEETASALHVERASVWLLDEVAGAIICQDLYVRGKNEHASGMSLLRVQFPAYFKTISAHQAILADDALAHPDTSEFGEVYFKPLGITSMLDVPIRLGNRTVGVLCCEHVGPRRFWTPEEEKFAISMAGSILLALENVKRREAETAMRAMNENLERLIEARTRELGESERRFQDLFEFAPDAMVMTNRSGLITLVNQAVERLFGHDRNELGGQPVEILVPGLLLTSEEARRTLAGSGQTLSLEAGRSLLHGLRKEGTLFPVDVSLSPVNTELGAAVISLRDVSDRENSQRILLRAQRLESIGTLAGGVAHDLNNALSPILLSAELLRERYPSESKLVDIVESSARRGTDMVRQLLTFARGVEGTRLMVRSRDLLGEAAKIVTGTFPKNIRFVLDCPDGLPPILGDTTQLHQVLLNLCVNARDAMPSGGILRLSGGEANLTLAETAEYPEARPGPHVVWRVQDTGTGIPPEIQERIFEPFFSTKDLEKGTGLGLSTVLGIVLSHGGFVRVQSTVGRGSTFSVYLPAAPPAVPLALEDSKTSAPFAVRDKLILVVDDEQLVLDMATALLTSLGFSVVTAADGTEALARAVEYAETLQVVLTDLHMPRMDGTELVRALREKLPRTPVIVSSGRLEERQAEELRLLGASTILHKPFRRRDLIEALMSVMGPV